MEFRATVYQVFPDGWTAARRSGLYLNDAYSVTVELHQHSWFIRRGERYWSAQRNRFETRTWYSAHPPVDCAYTDLDKALTVARQVANEQTDHLDRTFATVLAAHQPPTPAADGWARRRDDATTSDEE